MPGAPSLVGCAVALLFWAQSLTPTLIPRSWESQAGIGGTCLAVGYALGALAGWCARILLKRQRRVPADALRRYAWLLLGAAWPAAVLLGSLRWLGWQNEQRGIMGITSLVALDVVPMAAFSLLLGALLVVGGHAITRASSAGLRLVRRHVPGRALVPLTALLVAVSAFVLGRDALFRSAAALAESVYAPLNEETSEGTLPPRSASVSGSSASFVAWDTLGRQGRDFVASATTAHELAMFHGPAAALAEPVRVYVGVRSAGSVAERAQLAVRELERAGGFERKVLVVWVPTGTGWMIPEAAAALEQLYRGDTAIVAMQYSFLPSLVGVFLDAGLANEAGRALFSAVHARWSALPTDRRPQLLLFGKSLGTAGVEAPFVGDDASSSVANLVAATDGALIVGPKHSNVIHAQLTRAREPTSPAWQPVFGRSVRFLNRESSSPARSDDWPPPRIVYLQHPSDPVTFWGIDALWRAPEWMDEPRGFDVPDALRWFPAVSGVQAVGDLLRQLDVPPGFGHVYATEYVRGWVSVAPPDGWDEADTERLERLIDDAAAAESDP
ncbi:MAG TPA: alpha/beta-hydrolase family protein [Gammaproteobacteria bacterium]